MHIKKAWSLQNVQDRRDPFLRRFGIILYISWSSVTDRIICQFSKKIFLIKFKNDQSGGFNEKFIAEKKFNVPTFYQAIVCIRILRYSLQSQADRNIG